MKKLILASLLVVSLVFAASPLYAAERIFGVKGGVDIATLANIAIDVGGLGGEIGTFGWRTGAVGGVFMCWPIGEIFAIQPEALFAMKGAKENLGEIEGVPVNVTIKLDYLEFPLLARLNIPTGGTVRPNFYAGPVVGFKMSSRVQIEYGSLTAEDDVTDVNSVDLGLMVGGGLEFKLTSMRLLLDARYEGGLTSITADQSGVRNGAISFMAGLGFPF